MSFWGDLADGAQQGVNTYGAMQLIQEKARENRQGARTEAFQARRQAAIQARQGVRPDDANRALQETPGLMSWMGDATAKWVKSWQPETKVAGAATGAAPAATSPALAGGAGNDQLQMTQQPPAPGAVASPAYNGGGGAAAAPGAGIVGGSAITGPAPLPNGPNGPVQPAQPSGPDPVEARLKQTDYTSSTDPGDAYQNNSFDAQLYKDLYDIDEEYGGPEFAAKNLNIALDRARADSARMMAMAITSLGDGSPAAVDQAGQIMAHALNFLPDGGHAIYHAGQVAFGDPKDPTILPVNKDTMMGLFVAANDPSKFADWHETMFQHGVKEADAKETHRHNVAGEQTDAGNLQVRRGELDHKINQDAIANNAHLIDQAQANTTIGQNQQKIDQTALEHSDSLNRRNAAQLDEATKAVDGVIDVLAPPLDNVDPRGLTEAQAQQLGTRELADDVKRTLLPIAKVQPGSIANLVMDMVQPSGTPGANYPVFVDRSSLNDQGQIVMSSPYGAIPLSGRAAKIVQDNWDERAAKKAAQEEQARLQSAADAEAAAQAPAIQQNVQQGNQQALYGPNGAAQGADPLWGGPPMTTPMPSTMQP